MRRWGSVAAFVAAAVCVIVAMHVFGARYADGFALRNFSLRLDTRMAAFLAVFTFFGGLAAVLLARGFDRGLSGPGATHRFVQAWRSGRDPVVVAAVAGAVFVTAVIVRFAVVLDTPLSVDEVMNRFSADVVASGSVYADSPPFKLFWDRSMTVNDGRYFTQYFLGWPALLAPFRAVGLGALANPFYAAATVPAVFLVFRRLLGSGWARLGAVVFVTAPMVWIGASLQFSHTTCVFALAWATWFLFRSLDADAPWWSHAGLATAFSTAFFIRPTSALGIATPYLVVWAWSSRRRTRRANLVAAASFAVPAAGFAALFFAVNAMQTGSPLQVAYQRLIAYAAENDYRFTHLRPGRAPEVANFSFGNPGRAIAITSQGLLRLSFAAFGWPLGVVFVALAAGKRSGLFWASGACFVAVHLFVHDAGINLFAPMHYFELVLPLTFLVVLGVHRIATATPGLARVTVAGLAGVMLVSPVYAVHRCRAVRAMAEDARKPVVAADALGEPVVFVAEQGWDPPCAYAPRPHLNLAPVTLPGWTSGPMWVNHVSVVDDRALMTKMFADRDGYVLTWDDDCAVDLVPVFGRSRGAYPMNMDRKPEVVEP